MQLSHAIPDQNDKDINQIYSYRIAIDMCSRK